MAVRNHEESTFIRHEPCDACGSSDANSYWSDGHRYCHSCLKYTPPEEGDAVTQTKQQHHHNTNLLQGNPKAIPARGLTEEDCRKFGYHIGKKANGEPVQIAQYRNKNGKIVAQKIRGRDKSFSMIGNSKDITLFGSHLWSNGKKLCITEGEIDAISLSKVFGHKYAVVSLPSGAQSAVRAIKANFEYLNGFRDIIICTDMDRAGREAAQAIAEILPVGKAFIATLPAKDANEALMQGKTNDLIQAVYQAKPYRPDGIKTASDYRDTITVDEEASAITWPYSQLNSVLRGLRRSELCAVIAGSGTGKSTFCKEVIHHLLMSGQKVGVLALEESNKRTLLGLTGIHMSKNLLVDRQDVTDDEILRAFDDLFTDRTCVLFDSFGSNDIDTIIQRIQHMVRSHGCKYIILDHLSILVSATEGDERRMLDAACTKFRTLVQELDIGMIMVSHLSRPSGDRGHEAGAAVRLNSIRGSHALAQLSDACIALQVDPDEPDSDIRHLRILKNRYTGETGDAGTLVYDRETGRLLEEELSHLLHETLEQGDPEDEEQDITTGSNTEPSA